LWGWGAEGRKITWSSWENICNPKEEGDIGIRHIDLFNKALLAKWLWRMELEGCPRIKVWIEEGKFNYIKPKEVKI